MARWKKVLLWVVSVLLAAVFVLAGSDKLTPASQMAAMFAAWGYAPWFRFLIGLVETLGGITLLVPRVARFGAVTLTVVMLGAAFTHVRAGEWPNPLFNLVFAAGLLWIARNRK